jgi:hypothetical protein
MFELDEGTGVELGSGLGVGLAVGRLRGIVTEVLLNYTS